MAAAKKKPSSLADNPPIELYGPEDGGWYSTRVHDWIGLCPYLRDPDIRGYIVLRSLVIEKYKNPVRKLTLLDLCELIPSPTPGQPSSLTRVRGILQGLSAVGLVSTPEGGPVKTSSRPSAAGKPIRIRVNDLPPADYAGWRNTEDKLAHILQRRTEVAAKAPGRKSDPEPEDSEAEDGPGRISDPAGLKSDPQGPKSDPDPVADQQEADGPLVPSVGTSTGGQAPSARSAGDARRASDGSSVREADGGFAAAEEEGSSSDGEGGYPNLPGQRKPGAPEMSREQLAGVRAVEAVLPPVLLPLMPYGQFPKRNRAAVLQALESRTVEQIRERVERRWLAYGYEPAVYDGTLASPIGAALELIAPTRYCPDLSCEDGTMIDTGAECRACLQRRADRRAARAAGQLLKSGSKGAGSGRAPECVICQAPFRGAVPEDGECRRCREEAVTAAEALRARWGQSGADRQTPTADAAVEDAPDSPGDLDDETARLCAFYARQYGTPEQIEAYCGTEEAAAYGPPPF